MLFAVLPFAHDGQPRDDVLPGTDPGAPGNPRLIRVVLLTSLIAAVLFAGVYVYFGVLGYTLEDLLI